MPRKISNPPPASSEGVHKSMASNKAKGTRLELEVVSALRRRKQFGYRLNWSGVPGKPDVAFPKYRLAIFVHGCFWHLCPKCGIHIPATHRSYWKQKLESNAERDKLTIEYLHSIGWTTLIIWEHEAKKDPEKAVDRIMETLSHLKITQRSVSADSRNSACLR